MDPDFAYAYWVDDKDLRITGADIGFMNIVDGEIHSGVVTLAAARRLGEQLLAVVDEIELDFAGE